MRHNASFRGISSLRKGLTRCQIIAFSENGGYWNGCNYLTEAESPVARFGSILGDSVAIRPQSLWSSHEARLGMRHNLYFGVL